ncbi:ATP-binding protein [Streptomyces mirabilis]|uniref:ATP-binding protein n=1 Tax=Streptomyces mirabilis TaxID=68239 RepID=UPI0036C6CD6E
MHSPFHQPPPPLGALRHLCYRQPYPGLVDSVPAAREHFAKAAARGGLDSSVTEIALLCLSELATNAVVHARRRFIVTVSVRGMRQRSVRVEVHDTHEGAPAFPRSRDLALDYLAWLDGETSGRGLAMVAVMADRGGVEWGPNGKAVWFELRLDRPGAADSPAAEEGAATVTR